MRIATRFLFAATVVLLLMPGPAAKAADDRDRILRDLDAAAANFHSTAADFEFDSVTTDPIPDKDVQNGTVYFERKNKSFQGGAYPGRERQASSQGLRTLRAGTSSSSTSGLTR